MEDQRLEFMAVIDRGGSLSGRSRVGWGASGCGLQVDVTGGLVDCRHCEARNGSTAMSRRLRFWIGSLWLATCHRSLASWVSTG